MGIDPTIRKRSQRVEFFWLCEKCSAKLTVKYQKGSGITVAPLPLAV